MTDLEKIITDVEALQKEMHEFIEGMQKHGTERGKTLNYESLQTVFILFKLTELQDRIGDIGSRIW